MAVGVAAPPGHRDPARHPGPRARGVPHRARRVEGRHLPDAPGLGRGLRPRARRGDGRPRSATRCGRSASTRASRRCSTSSATPAGAGSTSASPRTRTSWAPSARRTCGACSRPGCTPPSSTSSATPRRRPAATSPRCTPARASSPTCCSSRSRWRCSTAGARSVMHSYAEIDGVPVAADPDLLTGLLRDQWGFDGTVVADYFGVAFLHLLHHVAADLGEAAALALAAGVDVELPTGDAYLAPLAAAVRDGRGRRGARRPRGAARAAPRRRSSGCSTRPSRTTPPSSVDLDGPEHRAVAARLAEESVVLLANDGILPLARPGHGGRASARTPTGSRRSSAATPSSTTSSRSTRAPRPASTSPPCARRCAAEWPGAEIVVAPRLRRRRRRPSPASPEAVALARPLPTSRWSSSATTPASSAAAPSARAATATTWSCPACSASWSRPCSPRGRRSSSCCSPAGRTPSAGRWSAAPPWCRPSSPARRVAGAIAGVLSGRVNPSGGCR